ncbi:hypothetical protein [Oceanobacillus sp. CF4.6]|uniref:hypothetical protein n=1 Tax=Oceanobacillus sp. CF4.6 TaxID=3373080 RepID=UPI003EE725C7
MKTKKLYFLLVSALFLVVLTACGGTNENDEGTETETEESEADVTEESAEQEDIENNEEAGTEDSAPDDDQDEASEPAEEEAEKEDDESENDDAATDTIKEEATYSGQGDPHTIEVETADETIALQIIEFMEDDWASLEPGTPMSIEYYKNEMGQLILVDYTVE